MDQISAKLSPYKESLATTAIILGVIKCFVGFFTCYEIISESCTAKQSSLATVGSLCAALLGLEFARLSEDNTLFYIYLLQVAVDCATLAVFANYSWEVWNEVGFPLAKGLAVVAAGMVYVYAEDPSKVTDRFGTGLSIITLAVLAQPLIDLVIRG